MNYEGIARVCHEANRAYCIGIGDMSQPSWEDAPQWQKDSAIKGVVYRHCNPNSSAEEMHSAWVTQKIHDGWNYGPLKDPEKKEHPCIVLYHALPLDQRRKDKLFSAVFDSLRDW